MIIAVIYGGKSGEHEVSLVSAAAVARNIGGEHTVVLIGIDKDGAWFVQPEQELSRVRGHEDAALRIVRDDSARVAVVPGGGKARALRTAGGTALPVDIVFPVLHGTFGEDGTIQGLFEMADVPYVGCGVLGSAAAMDKEKTKRLWQAAGLPVVPFICVYARDVHSGALDGRLSEAEQAFGYPLFVKPCCAGSSVGAARARSREELEQAVTEAFRWDTKILIERSVNAREIECSVTGNADISDSVIAYTPGEIAPSYDFYDYNAKYTDPDGAAFYIPARLTEDQLSFIQNTAVSAFKALGCCGFARVDFFADRGTGCIYLNELNTIPGFTPISMFSKMCGASGLGYAALVELLIELGFEQFASKHSLRTDRG